MNSDNNDFMGYVPSSGQKYEILPEGTYDFVIHGIVGLGIRPRMYEGKEIGQQAVIKIIFEIPEHIREDGQTELLSIKLPISANEKSNYYKFCTTVLGQNITDNEENMKKLCMATGMKELLGKVGTLTVATWKNGEGRSVSNKGFFPLHPKAPKPIPTRDFVFFNPFNPDLKVFKENLTAWTRKEIMEALNAESFSDDLKQTYEECKKEDLEKQLQNQDDSNNNESSPWAGNAEAIE